MTARMQNIVTTTISHPRSKSFIGLVFRILTCPIQYLCRAAQRFGVGVER